MRSVLGMSMAASLLVSMVALSPAAADDARGKVQTVDAVSNVVVLEDGTQIWVAPEVLRSVHQGDTVMASYEVVNGRKVAVGFERRTMSPVGEAIASPRETTNFGATE